MKRLILLSLLLTGCNIDEVIDSLETHTPSEIYATTFEYSVDDYLTLPDGFTDIDLRAVVAYPSDLAGIPIIGNHPVFLMQHGQHKFCYDTNQTAASCVNRVDNHHGFMDLLKNLAENGYIAVSIDAYDLLARHPSDTGTLQGIYAEQREALFEEHLQYLISGDSIISGFLDVANITLAGHSRGADAAYEAAKVIDGVTRVVAIAPTGINHTGIDADIFVVIGSADNDIIDFNGYQMYSNANIPINKGMAYVHGANHSWFNSIWDKDDSASQRTEFISHEDQVMVAAELITEFITGNKSLFLTRFNIDYSYREPYAYVLTDGIDKVAPELEVSWSVSGNYYQKKYSYNQVKDVTGQGDITFSVPFDNYKKLSLRVALVDNYQEHRLIITTDTGSVETDIIPIAYDLVPSWGMPKKHFMSTLTVDLTGYTSTVRITIPDNLHLYLDDIELR